MLFLCGISLREIALFRAVAVNLFKLQHKLELKLQHSLTLRRQKLRFKFKFKS